MAASTRLATRTPYAAGVGFDAVLLVSFGGPEGPDDVMPFLENVLRGRPVPPERMQQVAAHYLEFGGVSPINEQNRALVTALTRALAERGTTICPSIGATVTGTRTCATWCGAMASRRGPAGRGLRHLGLLVVQRVPAVPWRTWPGLVTRPVRAHPRSSSCGRISITRDSSQPLADGLRVGPGRGRARRPGPDERPQHPGGDGGHL